MRIVSYILLSILCLPVCGQQQHGLKGTYCLDNFPEVTFVWNNADPIAIKKSNVTLFIDGKEVEFECKECKSTKDVSLKKSILFLWEDMASHGSQSAFTRELLSHFLKNSSGGNDRFAVAVFDRHKDSDSKMLNILTGHFTSDGKLLASSVDAYETNGRHYTTFPKQSDLYLAINEGISLLKSEPSDYAGAIIVITAGLNIKVSGASTEMETVRRNALDSGIPIYVVKYPLEGNAPEINVLSESTYGMVIASTYNTNEAEKSLSNCYKQLDSRLYGRDYKFTFNVGSEYDGKTHPVQMSVDKVIVSLPPYTAPSVSVGMWVSSHWWLIALMAIAVLFTVVMILHYVRKKIKKQSLENQSLQEELTKQQEESEKRNREALENLKREQEEKEFAKNELAENERLQHLMRNKNYYPRLQCIVGNESFTYTIDKIKVCLGRESSNDVVFRMKNESFNPQTVSRHHAEIVFNGTSFEIINKSQTHKRGVIVNGQFYQRYTLHNGDKIGLGEAVVIFYL